MFRKLIIYSVATLGWITSTPASAELRIFACEPEWAALAREIGGDKVTHIPPPMTDKTPTIFAPVRVLSPKFAVPIWCFAAGQGWRSAGCPF